MRIPYLVADGVPFEFEHRRWISRIRAGPPPPRANVCVIVSVVALYDLCPGSPPSPPPSLPLPLPLRSGGVAAAKAAAAAAAAAGQYCCAEYEGGGGGYDVKPDVDFYAAAEPQVDIIQSSDAQTQTSCTPEQQVLRRLQALEAAVSGLRDDMRRDREARQSVADRHVKRILDGQRALVDKFLAAARR